jgi:hypothetical protein
MLSMTYGDESNTMFCLILASLLEMYEVVILQLFLLEEVIKILIRN